MVRLVLVFNVVLNGHVGWVGRVCRNERKAYLGLLLRINVVNAVNGLYFFAVPYPISVDRAESAHAQRTDRACTSLTGLGRAAGRSSRGQTNLCEPKTCAFSAAKERKRRCDTHMWCSEAILYGNGRRQNEIRARNRRGRT